MIGQTLSHYRIEQKLGSGGMGVVYRAKDSKLGRDVAIKVLREELASDPDRLRRFEQEARAASALDHPNIITIHDIAESGGVHFIVMQYVEGSDLAALVRARGTLPISTAIDYLIQAGRGLEYAHGQGVIHRDIKPSNLLLDDQGTVKILDMGLARIEQETGSDDTDRLASLTQSGQVMGTIDYMPPEQSFDTHRADHRADIYSLGCTLFYLLTGRPVFPGETLAKKIMLRLGT